MSTQIPPSPKRLWFNVGEASGDQHGAILIREILKLNPDVQCIGMGGQAMFDAGMTTLIRSEELSVMGLTEVFGRIPKILSFLRCIRRELSKHRPLAVVLIDAPAFNFRVARIAHDLGIPVIYYISPKIWAWRQGRVKFIRNYVQRMICILPFETNFYARFGVTVDYVGHPLLDETRTPDILAVTPQKNRLVVLPGSRKSEIDSMTPLFGLAVQRLRQSIPNLDVRLVLAPGITESRIRELWPNDVPLTLEPHTNRYQIIRSSRAALAASGTVTLETALLQTPTVVAYKFSWLTASLLRMFIKVRFASLPNLILNREVSPELIQEKATSDLMYAHLAPWFLDDVSWETARTNLSTLPKVLGAGGAAHRAAVLVLKTCGL